MAHGELTAGQEFLHRLRKPQNAKKVRYSGPFFAHPARDFFLSQSEFVMQLVVGACLFNRVQVFALNVFDEGDLQSISLFH